MAHKNTDEALAWWAEEGDFRPRRAATGAAASAEGRALLEAAGVDVDAVERSGGRPRIDGGAGPKGTRSPRVNVSISPEVDALLEAAGRHRGVSRSELVREALDNYLRHQAS